MMNFVIQSFLNLVYSWNRPLWILLDTKTRTFLFIMDKGKRELGFIV